MELADRPGGASENARDLLGRKKRLQRTCVTVCCDVWQWDSLDHAMLGFQSSALGMSRISST